MNNKNDIGDYISEAFSDRFRAKFTELIETEATRQKIIAVFNEEIQKVDFAKKVKGYAAEEMDARLIRSAKYWFIVILTAVITALTTLGISRLF